MLDLVDVVYSMFSNMNEFSAACMITNKTKKSVG
jgi:hypothetical protein